MQRQITKFIATIMDECLPPIIRDSKWFMYPFYLYAYRGKHIGQVMRYKSLAHKMSPEKYAEFYNSIDTISRNRKTDLNEACIERVLSSFDSADATCLEVGSGNGYLLAQISKRLPEVILTACDLKQPKELSRADFVKGDFLSTHFANACFDVVVCCHTLEHIVEPHEFVAKLKRVCKRKLIIIVPCQRYFYYTLDEHVNFFHYKEALTSLLDMSEFVCEKVRGDWFYIGWVSDKGV